MRWWRRAPGLLCAASVLLAACSGGGGEAQGPAGTGPAPAPGGAVALTVTGAEVQAMSARAPAFPEDVKAAVLASLGTYVNNGVVAPLRTGKPPSGLEGVFTGAAAARLGPDRSGLLEDGAARSGEVRQDRANVKLIALTGPGGEPVLVTAVVDIALTVADRLAVVRTGELVLVPDNNAWRIDSYDLRTQRDGQGRS